MELGAATRDPHTPVQYPMKATIQEADISEDIERCTEGGSRGWKGRGAEVGSLPFGWTFAGGEQIKPEATSGVHIL